jgi:hypothetical protein
MALRRLPLRQFLNDFDASPGWVYMWDGAPFVQIHYRGGQYTCFWLGSCNAESIASGASAMTARINETIIRRGFGTWSVKVRCAYKQTGNPTDLYSVTESPFQSKIRPSDLKDAVLQHLRPFTEASAFYVSLISNNVGHSLMVWGDSEISPFDEREVGFTSTLPIEDTALDLFTQTSSFVDRVPREETEDLFVNELPRRMKDALV